MPKNCQFVPDAAKLSAGTPLGACYGGKWCPITFLSHNEDGTLNVRWDDYGPAFDCSMLRAELIIENRVLQKSGTKGRLRTWIDSTGKHRVKARLVEKSESQVTLKTTEGKVVTLPISKLSSRDKKYLDGLDD